MQLLFGQGEAFAVSAVHDQDDDLKRKVKKKKKKRGHGVRIQSLISMRTTHI